MAASFSISPVAIAHTPFKQKFAIPRQAGLVDIPAVIELLPPYNQAIAVDGLEGVSHIWLTFLFHQHGDQTASLQVRPPRLGGNQKVGVFATRSSFRPNGLGQSVVRLETVEKSHQHVRLHVRGIDLLDQTPIIDIKPYLPYADIVANAHNAIANDKPVQSVQVSWSDEAKCQLAPFANKEPQLTQWITELIQYDPRPAYKQNDAGGVYAMQLFNMDIQWIMHRADHAVISAIKPLSCGE